MNRAQFTSAEPKKDGMRPFMDIDAWDEQKQFDH
jgi:hypothetical protein